MLVISIWYLKSIVVQKNQFIIMNIKHYKIRYIQLVDQLVLYFTEVCTIDVGTWICKINVLKGVTPKTDNLLVERS